MNKYIIVLVLAVILVIGGSIYFASTPKPGQNVDQNINQNNVQSEQNQQVADTSVIEFKLDATRWQYSPSVITVKKGQRVKITINNIDTTHGISIPAFDVDDKNSVEFTADKVGEFEFACSTFCGQGHKDMKGKLVVTEN